MDRILAQQYVGNIEAADLSARVAEARTEGRCFEVEIERCDRAKGRILTQTRNAQPVGIVKDRSWQLREGDIFETLENALVVVHLKDQKLMTLRFSGERHQATALVQLGYTLGNQHWPTTLQGSAVYVEMVADEAVMEKMVKEAAKTLGIEGLQITFEAKPHSEAVVFHTHHSHAGHSH